MICNCEEKNGCLIAKFRGELRIWSGCSSVRVFAKDIVSKNGGKEVEVGAVEAGGVVRGRSEERAQQGTVGHRGEHVPAKFMYA